ncbi:MAG: pyruvate dehydrogenase (acetyl-transferring) E1 component subunit alpha [Proteobacteria bacterium]|nr:pyruvate dehydrogenase (acetyl-transferring) E1 component subunit alpha [Pseudomonadota bacterium]
MTAKPHLDGAHARRLLGQMIRIRLFEEKCAELYTRGKIRGFLHLYIGEEANAVGVMEALTADDSVVSTYREHGHALARGIAMGPLMAEMYGKANGTSGGRGGSMHVFDRATRFYGGNAIVGGGLPLSVGLGLAERMRSGRGAAVCLFGEGAVAEGEFHESLNLAALWKLPVLFVCENNLYAMGSAIERTESETDIHRKAEAYRIASQRVDGMDVVAVEAATRAALEHLRAGEGPQFLECRTYRFRAHSMFDAQLYRDKSEVERWKERDPIKRFADWSVAARLLHKTDIADLEKAAAVEVDQAVAFAEAGDWESVADLGKFVLMDKVPA